MDMTSRPRGSDHALLMKRARCEIERLQSENARLRQHASEPIALLGMSCRFPGGSSTSRRLLEPAPQRRRCHRGNSARTVESC